MVRVVQSALATVASGLVLGLLAVGVSACGSSAEEAEDPQPSISTLVTTTSSTPDTTSTDPPEVTTSTNPPEQFTEADAEAAFLDAWRIYAAFIHDRSNEEQVRDRFGGVALDELIAFGRQLDDEQVLVEVAAGSLEPDVRTVRLGEQNEADIEFCDVAVSTKRDRESGEIVAEDKESLLTEVKLVLRNGLWRIESVSGLGTWPNDQGCPE